MAHMSQMSGSGLTDFGYLFPELQEDPDARLPTSRATLQALDDLGDLMHERGTSTDLDSTIPAAYTYFAQFVDHDIILENRTDEIANVASPELQPLLLQKVLLEVKNTRSAPLDLDSVYGHPALRQRDEMRLGEVTPDGARALEDLRHDLFRQGRMPEAPEHDREALIGDPRNDENLIVAQLHVAFLRAHNALVQRGFSFEEARTTLCRHYQWIVIHDFLPRIADPGIIARTLAGSPFHQMWNKPFFLPLEFTAAFRFGHSMVRRFYRHNARFPQASLQDLFTFTALSGNFDPPSREPFDTLPDVWVIDWSGFFDTTQNPARKIDTFLVHPLLELRDLTGQIRRVEPRLAVRDLRRGYLLRMPTGEAVARRMGYTPLTPEEIRRKGASPGQFQVLRKADLLGRTPLWFYILAEAKHYADGNRLGPVGSTLVAEVLIGLVRRSTDSILAGGGHWSPTLERQADNRFDLPDLLRLAGVLPPEQPVVPRPA